MLGLFLEAQGYPLPEHSKSKSALAPSIGGENEGAQIEGWFKTAKHRFGLHRFGEKIANDGFPSVGDCFPVGSRYSTWCVSLVERQP